MSTMNISLPDEMKAWVDEQVSRGRYANASDAIRDFIRRDQQAVAHLQSLIDEGVASGISETPPDKLLEDIKRRTRAKLKAAIEGFKKTFQA